MSACSRSTRAWWRTWRPILAGVLTMMTVVGLALFLLRASFGLILPWLLPLVYGSVIL
ncbi:MAG: hypothetical protein AB7P40_07245 [Chloroflexota bacterium]